MDIFEKRESIRSGTLSKRENLSLADRTERSKKITSLVVEWIEKYEKNVKGNSLNAVMVYLSMMSEVETDGLIDFLFKQRKQVIAPVVDSERGELIPRQIHNLETDLKRHRYGMLQPKADCPIYPLNQLEIIIVPGIAFDSKGYRLGYGKGFYDRFLPKCKHAITIGIAFHIQIVEDTYPQPWDISVQHIFSEEGMFSTV